MIAEKGADMIKSEHGKSTEIVILPRFDDVKLLQQALPVALKPLSLTISH